MEGIEAENQRRRRTHLGGEAQLVAVVAGEGVAGQQLALRAGETVGAGGAAEGHAKLQESREGVWVVFGGPCRQAGKGQVGRGGLLGAKERTCRRQGAVPERRRHWQQHEKQGTGVCSTA